MSTFDRIKNTLVVSFGVPADKVTPDVHFRDLGLDSIDSVEVVMECEEEFGIIIPDDELDLINSVAELAEAIDKHRAVPA